MARTRFVSGLAAALVLGWGAGEAIGGGGAPACRGPDLLNPRPYRLERDVVYDRIDGRDLLADVYRPEGPGPHPAVVLIHGGGWMIGDRTLIEGPAQHLARLGLVVLNIEYRLLGATRLRGAVRDSVCAVRWLRAHADDYDVSKECVGVAGDSAGGHLAAMVALAGDEARFAEGCEPAGDETADVSFALIWYGIVDWSVQIETYGPGILLWWAGEVLEAGEDWRAYSPKEFAARRPGVDFFVSHGRKDDLAEVAQSLRFASALGESGHRVTLQIIEEAKHGYFSWLFYLSPWGRLGQSATDAFLAQTLGRPPGPVP